MPSTDSIGIDDAPEDCIVEWWPIASLFRSSMITLYKYTTRIRINNKNYLTSRTLSKRVRRSWGNCRRPLLASRKKRQVKNLVTRWVMYSTYIYIFFWMGVTEVKYTIATFNECVFAQVMVKEEFEQPKSEMFEGMEPKAWFSCIYMWRLYHACICKWMHMYRWRVPTLILVNLLLAMVA